MAAGLQRPARSLGARPRKGQSRCALGRGEAVMRWPAGGWGRERARTPARKAEEERLGRAREGGKFGSGSRGFVVLRLGRRRGPSPSPGWARTPGAQSRFRPPGGAVALLPDPVVQETCGAGQ